jgi:hypothetical protein
MSALQRVMYNHMQTSGIILTEDKVRSQESVKALLIERPKLKSRHRRKLLFLSLAAGAVEPTRSSVYRQYHKRKDGRSNIASFDSIILRLV